MSAGGEIASGILELAKANQDAYLAAYEAGHTAGYIEGMKKAMQIIEQAGARAAAKDATVCPTCHGRGATAINSHTGATVYYCNCEVAT